MSKNPLENVNKGFDEELPEVQPPAGTPQPDRADVPPMTLPYDENAFANAGTKKKKSVDATEAKPSNKAWIIGGIVLFVIAAIAIGVAVPLALSSSDDDDATAAPTATYTSARLTISLPTTSPLMQWANLQAFLAAQLNVPAQNVDYVSLEAQGTAASVVTFAVLSPDAAAMTSKLSALTATAQYPITSVQTYAGKLTPTTAPTSGPATPAPTSTLPSFTLPPNVNNVLKAEVSGADGVFADLTTDAIMPVYMQSQLNATQRTKVANDLFLLFVNGSTTRTSATMAEVTATINSIVGTNTSTFAALDGTVVVDRAYIESALTIMPTHLYALYSRLS
eukprot:PhM_4_TR17839/c0_g1_i1/m.17221